ncbi:hypothetical protein SDC9_127694 [bioreactor metagenome]|uniref:Uncharacterized protein n=1 Tax=bioreactor metagenome TaxID=1076179 RepID=A0A645CUS2_9ZZZZ
MYTINDTVKLKISETKIANEIAAHDSPEPEA